MREGDGRSPSHEFNALKAIQRRIRIPLSRGKRAEELFRFGLVGICGFVVDGGLLLLLVTEFGTNPLVARGITFPVAVFTTWLINRRFTFDVGRSSAKGKVGEYSRYLIVQLAGAAVNLAIYGLLLMLIPTFWRTPLYALAIAAGFALIVNYLGARHIAFRLPRLVSRPEGRGWRTRRTAS